jgi:acyl transferase domain-containing protein
VVETDSRLLRIPKKDAKFMSVLQAHCLEAVWRALEDAGKGHHISQEPAPHNGLLVP